MLILEGKMAKNLYMIDEFGGFHMFPLSGQTQLRAATVISLSPARNTAYDQLPFRGKKKVDICS